MPWGNPSSARFRYRSPLLVEGLMETLISVVFYCIGYAGDLAIVVKGKFAVTISENTQITLNIVDEWCLEKEKDLKVSSIKDELCKYSNKYKERPNVLASEYLNTVEYAY